MPSPSGLRFPAIVGALSLGAVLSVAGPAAADEPVEVVVRDPDALPPPSARGSLLLLGAATTAAWYSLALGGGLIWPNSPGGDDLRIPVAGPWMALADTGCPDDNPKCAKWWVVVRAILIGIDGIGQAGGFAVMGEAAFMPTATPRSGQAVRRLPRPHQSADLQVRPVPYVAGRNAVGFGVVGQF